MNISMSEIAQLLPSSPASKQVQQLPFSTVFGLQIPTLKLHFSIYTHYVVSKATGGYLYDSHSYPTLLYKKYA